MQFESKVNEQVTQAVEDLIKSFTKQGYTKDQAEKIVFDMFGKNNGE